jgi:hypothetical protein
MITSAFKDRFLFANGMHHHPDKIETKNLNLSPAAYNFICKMMVLVEHIQQYWLIYVCVIMAILLLDILEYYYIRFYALRWMNRFFPDEDVLIDSTSMSTDGDEKSPQKCNLSLIDTSN